MVPRGQWRGENGNWFPDRGWFRYGFRAGGLMKGCLARPRLLLLPAALRELLVFPGMDEPAAAQPDVRQGMLKPGAPPMALGCVLQDQAAVGGQNAGIRIKVVETSSQAATRRVEIGGIQ